MEITHVSVPLPHPDHVEIDLNEATAINIDPAIKEKRESYVWLTECRTAFVEKLEWLRDKRDRSTDPSLVSSSERDTARPLRILETFDSRLP